MVWVDMELCESGCLINKQYKIMCRSSSGSAAVVHQSDGVWFNLWVLKPHVTASLVTKLTSTLHSEVCVW